MLPKEMDWVWHCFVIAGNAYHVVNALRQPLKAEVANAQGLVTVWELLRIALHTYISEWDGPKVMFALLAIGEVADKAASLFA